MKKAEAIERLHKSGMLRDALEKENAELRQKVTELRDNWKSSSKSNLKLSRESVDLKHKHKARQQKQRENDVIHLEKVEGLNEEIKSLNIVIDQRTETMHKREQEAINALADLDEVRAELSDRRALDKTNRLLFDRLNKDLLNRIENFRKTHEKQVTIISRYERQIQAIIEETPEPSYQRCEVAKLKEKIHVLTGKVQFAEKVLKHLAEKVLMQIVRGTK